MANVPHLTSSLDQGGKVVDGRLCAQIDASCLPGAGWTAHGYGELQLCTDSPVAPCLENLEYADAEGTWHAAVLSLKADLSAPNQDNYWIKPWGNFSLIGFQKDWGWSALPSANVPGSGKGPLVFSFPGRANAAGVETYALDATFDLSASLSSGGSLQSEISNFHFQVSPVKVISCQNTNVSVTVMQKDASGNVSFGQTGGSCLDPSLFTGPSYSGYATRFSDSYPIRLSMRMPGNQAGWFQGRMDNANIEVSPTPTGDAEVVVTGQPTLVPATHIALRFHEPSLANFFSKQDFDWTRQTESYGYRGVTGGN